MSNTATPARYDCIVIGGGHNGLVCAAKLARGGRSVLLLEARHQVGGAAITREFAPGFRVSGCAHLLHLMPAALMRELQLESCGLRWSARNLSTTALVPEGSPLSLGASGLESDDAAAYTTYLERMRHYARALVPLFSKAPPRLGTDDWGDRFALLGLAWQIRKLGRRDMRELLRIGGMNVYDLLEENFRSPSLKGALGFDAVLGSNFGPRSPGTVLTLLYRLAGAAAADSGALSQPVGGLGAVCDALGKSAVQAGAIIRCNSPVARIVVEGDRACGVELRSGEVFTGDAVISSAGPKTTFLELLGTRHLDTGFVRRVEHFRGKGLAAKLHLALDRVPRFVGVESGALRGRLLLSPSLNYLEHAYNHSKYGEFSASPAMEITVPTVNDPGLAPTGRHVLSAIVQYAPYALKGGWDAQQRGALLARCLELLEGVAPSLRQSVLHAEILTPPHLEREFGLEGGHWHHGDLAFDQFLFVRPVPGAAQHRTPIAGLFLCGAGCHPGGGVMGIAGGNAARAVMTAGAIA